MKKLKYILFILYLLFVVYLCFGHVSVGDDLPDAFLSIPIDKCVHFCMFLPFPILCTIAVSGKKPWRALSFSIIAGIAVATSLELLQGMLTDYRSTDIWDLVANLAAIVTGSLLTAAVLAMRGK